FNFISIFNSLLSLAQLVTKKKLLIGGFNDSILYTEGAIDSLRVTGIAGTNNAAGNFSALLVCITLFNFL
ncbi:hypothetical protein CHH56_19095, partial [Terribacillus saccharophilus]